MKQDLVIHLTKVTKTLKANTENYIIVKTLDLLKEMIQFFKVI